MGNKIKHLEMIENIIERMACNCFQIKGWTISLVVLVGALASQGSDQRYILLGFLPCIGFVFLDAYYLMLERKFKLLYKNVTNKRNKDIDFTMQTDSLIGKEKELERLNYRNCFFSYSVFGFYLLIIVAFAVLSAFILTSK